MGNLRPFQIILLGAFLAFALLGLMFFALFRGFGGEPNPYGSSVEIWGTLDGDALRIVMTEIADVDENFQVVQYREKDERTFEDELVNAIAEGRGPDAIILSHDALVGERAKIFPIAYESVSERTFRDTYIDGAEIFALSDGIYGLPLVVDPLVMYWNRDMFATAGLSSAPETWERFVSRMVSVLTKRTSDRDILQSAVAFGEFQNVLHAKEVLVMLMIQAGSALVFEDVGGQYALSLDEVFGDVARPPATAAVDFFTQFANPSRATYTWNRALPLDRDAFLSGDLALYFGFGSEFDGLVQANPNLNLDLARVPQGEGVSLHKGYGTFYAIAPLKSSDNLPGAYAATFALAAENSVLRLSQLLGMAPVQRITLSVGDPSAVRQALYDAALVARGWLDPSREGSEQIFRDLVSDVQSGRANTGEAVRDAVIRLRQLLP